MLLVVASAIGARVQSQIPLLGLARVGVMTLVAGYAVLRRNASTAMCVIAYLPGRRDRVASGPTPRCPYLAAPYLVIVICVALTFLVFGSINGSGRTALLYLGLLLPSSIVTIATPRRLARQAIAFALAGPSALAAIVILLSQVRIEPWLYRRMLWTMVISGVGPLAIALTAINDYIVNTGTLEFDDESNFITSGGFGPVQVSSVMGLTALVAILLCLVEGELVPRVLAGLIALGATVQSFLTFSRGGMFATAFALAGLALSQAGSRDTRRRVLLRRRRRVRHRLLPGGPARGRASPTASSPNASGAPSPGAPRLANNDIQIFRHHLAFGVGPA